jgi:hypothetical protein
MTHDDSPSPADLAARALIRALAVAVAKTPPPPRQAAPDERASGTVELDSPRGVKQPQR